MGIKSRHPHQQGRLEHFEHFVHLERRRGENKSDVVAKRLLLLDIVVVCGGGGGMCGRQAGRKGGRPGSPNALSVREPDYDLR